MWYQVPKEPSTPKMKPKAIFPWERETDRPKATRVFADDTPEPVKPPSPPTLTLSPTEGSVEKLELAESNNTFADVGFQPFSAQPNAWDHDRSIDRYVRGLLESQNRRSRGTGGRTPEDILSPTSSTTPARRESLIITDFPSIDDRPSLPVTPAPIRRPIFWGGDDGDDAAELPAAEGVPNQADWVCPSCGFQPESPTAFLRSHPTSSITSPAALSQQPQPIPSRDLPENLGRAGPRPVSSSEVAGPSTKEDMLPKWLADKLSDTAEELAALDRKYSAVYEKIEIEPGPPMKKDSLVTEP